MSLISESDNKIRIHTCRICLASTSVEMLSIEEQNGWLQLFEFCFGFTLTIQDKPRLLCLICAKKVKNYAEFKEKCQKSHSLWKSVISDVKCYIVKHKNEKYDNKDINDTSTNTTQIKKELVDFNFDDDTLFDSNDIEMKMENFSPSEIKIENDLKNDDESNNRKKEDSVVELEVNSKQTSNGCEKSKEKKVYTCAKCKDTYERKSWYLKHIKICKNKKAKSHERPIFHQDFAYNLGRKYNGQRFEKIKHESESEIEVMENQNQNCFSSSCGLCNLSCTTTKDLCVHLNNHWSNNELACKLCDFVGSDLAATMAHRYSHFPRNGTVRFLCHICEKSLVSLLALHFHYRKEHLKRPGGYCSRCNKGYNELRLWKKHELAHCAPRYMCDICGKGFYYKHAIKDHIMNHIQPKKNICDVCGKIFTRLSYLRVHKDTVHTKTGPLKCYHCPRMFKSEYSLNMHIKNMVTREKTHKCDVCNKFFVTPKALKVHTVTHSDERPYRCDICGCCYKYKCHLKLHLLKHNGFLPQCSICSKAFASPMSLKRHSSVHTGVRKYACSVKNCVRTFHSKKLMLGHLELRHKNKNVEEI